MSNYLKALIILSVAIVTSATGLWIYQKFNRDDSSKKVYIPVKHKPVINYNKPDVVTEKRKEKYGLKKGVDIIVRSDESFKVGETTVSMREIKDKILLESGEIIEKDIKTGKRALSNEKEEFGIYVVNPGDNLWDIHFKFLKDYFDRKGIAVSPLADEPDRSGFSSGLGKLLKFSEKTVYIYNLKERKIDTNINLIFPLSKIVVYNMNRVFAILDNIDYRHVNKIEFDGETIWIPSGQ